jgi:hypothetical protein
MKPQLKKVKIARFLSEETTAFTAQLWVDGEYIADLSNDGHGGNNRIMHRFDGKGLNTRDKVEAFRKWCADYDLSPCCRAYTTYVENVLCCKVCYEEVSHGGVGDDLYISLMLEDYEGEQQIKRWCKTKTVIRLKSDKPGEFHIYKQVYDPALAQRIRDEEPTLVEILNERYI